MSKLEKKTSGLIILSILLLSIISGLNLSSKGTDTIDNYVSNTNDLGATEPITETYTQSTDIDYYAWYQGETVKTDIEFNKGTIDYYNPIHSFWRVVGTTTTFEECFNTQSHIFNIWADDGNSFLVKGEAETPLTSLTTGLCGYRTTYKMYCGGSGVLYYEMNGHYFYESASYRTATTMSGTHSIANSDLDSEGYIEIALNIYVDFASDQLWLNLIEITNTGQSYIESSYLNSVTDSSVYAFDIAADYLYFQRDTIINNVKSEYQYASPTTITHRLEIPSVPHAKEINIYYPDHWTYSSINPYASTTDSSYVLTINNPTELTYTTYFLSNCSDILAVNDISNTEFEHIGFEDSEYLEDWQSNDTETLEIRTDIAIETYSLYFENTAGGMNLNSLVENGYYYVSFRYYQTTTNLFKFYWYNDGWTSQELYTAGITERWREKTLFIQVNGSHTDQEIERNLVFYFSSGHYGKGYIDDFRICQVSTSIQTTSHNEYQADIILRTFDAYQQPTIAYESANISLWQDTVLLDSSLVLTNVDGLASWTFERELNSSLEYTLIVNASSSFENATYTFTPANFSEAPVLYETDSNFYLSSTNNTNQYEIYLDEQYLGIYNDLDVILKNSTYSEHNFTFILFTDGSNQAFIPVTYQYDYLVSLPALPQNDIYREQSSGYFNITIITNLDHYWIDIYHDEVLIYDDSTATQYSIEKAVLVGWHNITLLYTYNSTIDLDGNPCEEYNTTLSYEFWYETKLFYDVRLRYIPIDLGLAIGDFEPSWVLTYIDNELVLEGSIIDLPEYSNYSFISNYDIRIRNSMPSHNLVVKDLFGRLILNTTIDISTFTYAVLELPIYRLGVVNLNDEVHKLAIRPFLSGESWQYTPELAPGYFIEFWVCNRTYEFRVYGIDIDSSYYDQNGAYVIVWEETDISLSPRTVPTTIKIPLSLSTEEEEEAAKDNQLRNIALGVGISTLALLVVMFIFLIRNNRRAMRRRNEILNKYNLKKLGSK